MSNLSATSINSQKLGQRDYTRFWLEPDYFNLECLYATFHKHQYTPHVHETYAFGVIESGVELFRNRGCEMQAAAGQAVIVNPDDLHDGRPATEGFTYRMFYPAVGLMRSLVNDMTEGHCDQLPSFEHSVLKDQHLAEKTAHLHRTLDSEPSRLARDNALLDTLCLLIQRHAKFCNAVGQERESMLRLQKYMLAILHRILVCKH